MNAIVYSIIFYEVLGRKVQHKLWIRKWELFSEIPGKVSQNMIVLYIFHKLRWISDRFDTSVIQTGVLSKFEMIIVFHFI